MQELGAHCRGRRVAAAFTNDGRYADLVVAEDARLERRFRASIQLKEMLPVSVLISPLCATNGRMRQRRRNVLVLKR